LNESELGTVSALTQEGEGVVRAGKTAFVGGALPGESIRFRRVRRHRQHDDAVLLEVLAAAPERVMPRCAHFGSCGGCALQHLSAERQIQEKQGQLHAALERIGRTTPQRWLAPLTGPQWSYRRRARLGARFVNKKGRVVVGFRERIAPYVAALERCEVLAAPMDSLISPLSRMLTELSIRERVPQIEVAVADNGTALVLRVLAPPSAGDLERLQAFESEHGVRLYLQPGDLRSVARIKSAGEPATAESPLHYALPEFGLELEFEPTDFVQINSEVNRTLVAHAVELLELTPESKLLDLYCGLGNLTLACARRAGAVLGVEGDAALVERARHNARRNGLVNAQFIAADLAQPEAEFASRLPSGITHVLLDPPRVGARDVMRTIARLAPKRLLYISCHPGSLARDVGMLVHDHGFVLRAAGVLDMFPHTTHVESLALLTPENVNCIT
jgi:23S rRNA (uracil1939-C5)-methyltransferase